MSEKKIRQKTTETMLFGKVPPQARELEEAVLGAIMLEKSALDEVAGILTKPEMFYTDQHQYIYQAMLSLKAKSEPTDLLTVVQELMEQKHLDSVGGPYAVTKLTNTVISSANIVFHARIIFEKYAAREIIRIGGEMVGEGYEDSKDPFDTIESSVKQLKGVESNTAGNYSQAGDVAMDVMMDVVNQIQSGEIAMGIPTGSKQLDKKFHGWQQNDLIILAARASVGKTAKAIEFALAAALSNIPVALFSLEMVKRKIVSRMLSNVSEVPLENIKTGQLSEDQMRNLESSTNKISNIPIYIDDTSGVTVFYLVSQIKKLIKLYGVKLVIIDYLQLMKALSSKNSNREQDVAQISRELKEATMTLGITIIALSQLSREVERRKDNIPQLSDLRESGAIEQDADIIMAIYRPEYNGIYANEQGESTKGKTYIKVLKHRDGELGTLEFNANLSIQKFYDKEEGPEQLGLGSNWKPVAGIDFSRKIKAEDF